MEDGPFGQLAAVWASSSPVRDIFRQGAYRWLFAGLSLTFALVYSLVLPSWYTQRFSFTNWRYLDPQLLTFSVLLGLLLGWILALQIYAFRRLAVRQNQGLTLVAAVGALLPNLLCCTPVVPTVLAAFGLSAWTLLGVNTRIDGFFGVEKTWFLVASAALLVGMAVWSAKRVACAACGIGEAAEET